MDESQNRVAELEAQCADLEQQCEAHRPLLRFVSQLIGKLPEETQREVFGQLTASELQIFEGLVASAAPSPPPVEHQH